MLLGFTPDGGTLVTHGPEVQTMDLATGKRGRVFEPGTTGPASGAALSPDGKRLATANAAGIHLWEFATGKHLRSFGSGDYRRVCFSPDGKLLAALLMNDLHKQLELRDAETGKERWSWTPGFRPLSGIAFTPDGKTLIANGWAFWRTPPFADNTIRFLDVGTGEERQEIDTGTGVPYRISVSPDGKLVAAVCLRGALPPDRHVRVWEANGGREVLDLESPDEDYSHRKYLSAAVFTPDGKSLLTSGSGQRLLEWDLAEGRVRRRVGRSMADCPELAFTPDGKSLAVTGPLSVVRVIDWPTGALRSTGDNLFETDDIAFTPDGRSVATVAGAGRVALWDLGTGRERGYFDAPVPRHVRLSADARFAYDFEDYDPQNGGRKGIFIRDAETGRTRGRIPLDFAGRDHPFGVCTPGPKELALADYAGRAVHLLDPATGGHVARLFDLRMKVHHAEFADAGNLLVAFCTDHHVFVWDVARRAVLRRIDLADDGPAVNPDPALRERWPYAAALSADGTRIVYASQFGYVRLLDASTGREIRRYDNLRIAGCAFSPDGRTLARAGRGDQSVHLIELATDKERRRLKGHFGDVESLRFSADGTLLVSASGDTTALVWDLTGRRTNPEPCKPLAQADLDACWARLAGDDAPAAYDAARTLVSAPAQALPYLAAHLAPVESVDPERLARLIADLDSDQFADREKAAAEVEKIAEAASPALRKTLDGSPSAEVRRRLEAILARQSEELRNPTGDRLRLIRALEILELDGSGRAREILQSLAKGLPDVRLTKDAKASLARLTQRSLTSP
jgi:WD40 repeat protein